MAGGRRSGAAVRQMEESPPFAALYARRHSNLLTVSEVLALPPRRDLVEGLVPNPGMVALYGAANVGKTFIALDLALSVASGGRQWLGHQLNRTGPVIYIAGEGFTGLPNRIRAWLTDQRCATPDALQILLTRTPPQLGDPLGLDSLMAPARDLQPTLIVLDTLASCTEGLDENSSKDMGNFVASLRRLVNELGATVLVVHHQGKDKRRGMRGHNALLGAVDTVLRLTGGDGGHVTLECEKQRDGERFRHIPLRLVRCGASLVPKLALTEASRPLTSQRTEVTKGLTGSQQSVATVWEAICACCAPGQTFLKREVTPLLTGVPKRTQSDALRRLVDAEAVKRIYHGAYRRLRQDVAGGGEPLSSTRPISLIR